MLSRIRNWVRKFKELRMFYQAVVEDNNDPLELGRVRIRIVGKHTKNRTDSANPNEYMPVEDLPWAIPSFPITSPMISGEGSFGVPNNGSVVLCGFLDYDEQHPFYFGVIPKIPIVQPDFTEGFSDPDEVYPKSDYLNVSPIPKNARGEELRTVATFKGEPPLETSGNYPFNKVIQTSSGHVIELDDTDGSERICIYHTSGTAIEMQSDGKLVMRGNAETYLSTKSSYTEYALSKTENIDTFIIENALTKTENITNTITATCTTRIENATTKTENITNGSTENVGTKVINSDGVITLTAGGIATVQGSTVVLQGAGNTLTIY
jgi:hypothetical protein